MPFFFSSDTLQVDVNASVTAKEVSEVSSKNGGRLRVSEGFNGIFVDFKCDRIEIDQL